MQRLYRDDDGTVRFHANSIVRYLLDNGGHDLNKLSAMGFDNEDWKQFMQLIGYSASGYLDLRCAQSGDEMWRVVKAEEKFRRKENNANP
jgi:hypothetical protein